MTDFSEKPNGAAATLAVVAGVVVLLPSLTALLFAVFAAASAVF